MSENSLDSLLIDTRAAKNSSFLMHIYDSLAMSWPCMTYSRYRPTPFLLPNLFYKLIHEICPIDLAFQRNNDIVELYWNLQRKNTLEFAFLHMNKPNDLGKNLRRGRGKMSKVEVIQRVEKGEHRREN